MKRLLAISWEMPPLSGPRAVQVTRTLEHLVPLGWSSTVICFGPRSTRYNQDYAADPERATNGAIELVRVPSPEEWLFFRALWRVCPPAKLMPDEKWVWIRRAAAAARRQAATRPHTAMASFGQPWSDHLVALRLRRETAMPWVAHFSDPWVDSPYARGASWQRRLWSRMERDVVGDADRLIFHNRQTADRTMSKYPAAWRSKVAIVPQGFEPESRTLNVARSTPAPLRVVYTGRFYDRMRTPENLLRAVAQLGLDRLRGRIAFDFFGHPSAAYARQARDLGLDTIVRFHGRVPPPQAVAAARAADLLLVIDAPSTGPNLFLPSKLVDYLALKKPILAITPREGASADLVRELGYTIVDPGDVDGIAAAVSSAIDAWQRGTAVVSPAHDEVASRYDIRQTARRFADVLDGLAPARTGAA
jgi:glycosyltransferase involved in cell wall biosynthesis